MNMGDPYTPTGEYIYECRECLTHTRSETAITSCPACDGAVQNIAVPRE